MQGGSLVASQRICLPMWEMRVPSLGWKDALEKQTATHSSILAWEISWTEKPGRLQSTGLQRGAQLSDYTTTRDSRLQLD